MSESDEKNDLHPLYIDHGEAEHIKRQIRAKTDKSKVIFWLVLIVLSLIIMLSGHFYISRNHGFGVVFWIPLITLPLFWGLMLLFTLSSYISAAYVNTFNIRIYPDRIILPSTRIATIFKHEQSIIFFKDVNRVYWCPSDTRYLLISFKELKEEIEVRPYLLEKSIISDQARFKDRIRKVSILDETSLSKHLDYYASRNKDPTKRRKKRVNGPIHYENI